LTQIASAVAGKSSRNKSQNIGMFSNHSIWEIENSARLNCAQAETKLLGGAFN
jgi:hypothetical protein